tara:strand:- start:190 stop:390 length:201 start_codon:yes stop_codon:yes gene_type:complete
MIDKKTKNFDLKKVKQEIQTLKKTLLNLNFQKSTGQLEKTAEISKTKKNIAKLKTQISNSIGGNNA